MMSGDIIEKYEKILIIMMSNIPSYACAISDRAKSEVILTGGFSTRKDVTAYNLQGRVARLPELQKGRQYHACSSYKSGTQTVKIVVPNEIRR